MTSLEVAHASNPRSSQRAQFTNPAELCKSSIERFTMKRQMALTTFKVFEAFIGRLRADPNVDDLVCDRLESALTSGQIINAVNLKEALFADEGVDRLFGSARM